MTQPADTKDTRSLLVLPLVGLAVLVLLAALLTIAYRQHRELITLRAQAATRTGTVDLGRGTVRSDSAETTQEMLEAIVAEGGLDLGGVVADAKGRDERLTAGQTTRATTPGLRAQALPSSRSETLPVELRAQGVVDPYGRLARREWLDLSEPIGNGTSAPWGRVGFAAAVEAPWSLEVHPRTYHATTAVTVDEAGHRTGYAALAIEVEGRRYPLRIAESLYREVLPTARFRFDPHVFLGLGAGLTVRPLLHAEVEPELALGLFSYGRTKVLPTWSLLALGVAWQGVASAPAVMLTPAAWNAGEPLPLLDNLYLGPSVSVGTGGDVAVVVSLRAAL